MPKSINVRDSFTAHSLSSKFKPQ